MIRIFSRLIKNNKKIGRNLISLMLLNLTLFIILLLYFTVGNYYDNKIKNSILNRTLAFSSDSIEIEKLKQINGVLNIYKYAITPIKYDEQEVFYDNIDELSYQIIIGSSVINGNEIIVSDDFIKSVSKNINDEITINNITFNIVGIYHHDLKTKNSIFFSNDYANKLIDSNLYKVIVDDYDSIIDVQNKLSNFDIVANILNDDGIKEINMYCNLFNISKIIMLIIFTMLIVINIIFINDIFVIYKKQIALLKVFGYKNWIIVFYILLNIVVMYILELLIYLILIPYIQNVGKSVLYMCSIDFILIFINYINLLIKFKRISIIKLLKE